MTFSRPLEPDATDYTTAQNYVLKREINQGVIFAKGDENPKSDKQDSPLEQHSLDSMGGTYVDLSVEFTPDSEPLEAPLVPVKGESSPLPSGVGGTSSGTSSDTASASGDPTGSSTTRSHASGTGSVTAPTASPGETDSPGSSSPSGTSTSSSTSTLSYSNVITLHAVCAASAW